MSAVSRDLGALYLQHRDAMYKVAASVLRGAGRAAEAEDAVSEAILSIIAAPPDDVQNWEAFLVTAAKRKALDRLRSADVRHAGGEFDPSVHDQADRADLAEDIAEDLDRRQQAALAWDALAILDDRHRRAVWLFVALERVRSEVATELEVTPARVSQMTKGALRKLREEMRRREEEDGG